MIKCAISLALFFAVFSFANMAVYAWQAPSIEQLYQKLDNTSDAVQIEQALAQIQAYSSIIESNDRLAAKYHETLAVHLRYQSKYDSGLYHAQLALDRLPDEASNSIRAEVFITLASLNHNLGNYGNARINLDSARPLATSMANQRSILALEMNLFANERDSPKYIESLREFLSLTQEDTTLQGRRDKVFALQRIFLKLQKTAETDTLNALIDQTEKVLQKIPLSSKYQFSARHSHARYFIKEKQFEKALFKLIQLNTVLAQVTKKELQAKYYKTWIDLWNTSARDKAFQSQYLNTTTWLYPPAVCVERLNKLYEDLNLDTKETVLKILIKYNKRVRNWERATRLSEELYRLEVQDFQRKIDKSYIKDRELAEENTRLKEQAQQHEIDLKNSQLLEAQLSQRFLIAGILVALIFGYFMYRNARQRKVQNLLLAKQKEEIEKMDELKSRFFVNISHEFRTPLTLVLGTLGKVLSGKLGSVSKQHGSALKNVETNTQRMLRLVNDMLDLSRIEKKQELVEIRKVNVAEKLKSIVSLFDLKLSEMALDVDLLGNSETELYIDNFKLDTILFNLLGNAVKYARPKTSIGIEWKESPEEVEINISNRGKGIEKADLPFVFDRFFQAGNKKTGEGTGIGLALTKELVELLQGEISVSSVSDSTTFKLRFKSGKAHWPEKDILQEETEDLELSTVKSRGLKTVLLVEDNPQMMAHTKDLLEEDFVVHGASTGKEALNVLNDVTPDLIITDFMMPEMNGVEFFRAVKSSDHISSVPFIFLTARLIEEERDNLLLEGVSDYIIKPFEPSDLKRRVHELLNLKEERDLVFKVSNGVDTDFDFVNRLRGQVIEQVADTALSPSVLADAFSISERTLYRKIKESTGFTPQGYIREVRMQEARRLINANNNLSIAEVAYSLGFSDPGYFSKTYKKRFGNSPSGTK